MARLGTAAIHFTPRDGMEWLEQRRNRYDELFDAFIDSRLCQPAPSTGKHSDADDVAAVSEELQTCQGARFEKSGGMNATADVDSTGTAIPHGPSIHRPQFSRELAGMEGCADTELVKEKDDEGNGKAGEGGVEGDGGVVLGRRGLQPRPANTAASMLPWDARVTPWLLVPRKSSSHSGHGVVCARSATQRLNGCFGGGSSCHDKSQALPTSTSSSTITSAPTTTLASAFVSDPTSPTHLVYSPEAAADGIRCPSAGATKPHTPKTSSPPPSMARSSVSRRPMLTTNAQQYGPLSEKFGVRYTPYTHDDAPLSPLMSAKSSQQWNAYQSFSPMSGGSSSDEAFAALPMSPSSDSSPMFEQSYNYGTSFCGTALDLPDYQFGSDYSSQSLGRLTHSPVGQEHAWASEQETRLLPLDMAFTGRTGAHQVQAIPRQMPQQQQQQAGHTPQQQQRRQQQQQENQRRRRPHQQQDDMVRHPHAAAMPPGAQAWWGCATSANPGARPAPSQSQPCTPTYPRGPQAGPRHGQAPAYFDQSSSLTPDGLLLQYFPDPTYTPALSPLAEPFANLGHALAASHQQQPAPPPSGSASVVYAPAFARRPSDSSMSDSLASPSVSPPAPPPAPSRASRIPAQRTYSSDGHGHIVPGAPLHRRSKTTGSIDAPPFQHQQRVGFVNFTPDDSKKILLGVAPSGSSKTKARREKEAADKRRRLGMAAARAVFEAGGDVGSLERQGLFL